jgi:predicted amidophosphoribosyltransferase
MISIKLIQSRDSRFRNNIFVDENFFQLERNIERNRHGNYNQRRSVLEGAFSANSKILNSMPRRRYKWKIIIIDDVLTTGAHLEECLRATKSKYFNLNYEVLGVFLAATQRPEFVDRTAITYGIPKVIEVFDR